MDPYEAIAYYYDLEHDGFHDDIDFYLDSIPGGPILEVGAGTGRIMAPLLRSGLEVCGIEPSGAMLDRARARIAGLGGAELCQMSIEAYGSERRFATAIMSLNALWHLPSPAQQIAALRVVRRHLVPGGQLFIDQSNPLTMADRQAGGLVRRRFEDRSRAIVVVGFSSADHDEASQIVDLSMWYDCFEPNGPVTRITTQLRLRYLYWAELDLALRLTGFRASDWYGSYDSEPYQSLSPNLIAVAQAVEEE